MVWNKRHKLTGCVVRMRQHSRTSCKFVSSSAVPQAVTVVLVLVVVTVVAVVVWVVVVIFVVESSASVREGRRSVYETNGLVRLSLVEWQARPCVYICRW